MEEGGQRLLVSRVGVCLPVQSSWPGLAWPEETSSSRAFSKVTCGLPLEHLLG